jgi:hypothetical protein
MGVRSNVVIVLASLTLFACGSAKNGGEAKGPESNPWADYKGTDATSAGESGSPSARLKAAKVEAAKTEAPVEEPVAAAVVEEPAPAPVAAPPAKKAKGGGAKPAKKKK